MKRSDMKRDDMKRDDMKRDDMKRDDMKMDKMKRDNMKKNGMPRNKKTLRAQMKVCCIAVLFSLLLVACGGTGVSGTGGETENAASGIGAIGAADKVSGDGTQRPEWVYVPEWIELGDQGAAYDYGNMRLIGDTVCYVTSFTEGTEDGNSICRYSLSDRKLTKIPIDWQDGGSIHEICCYDFDKERNTWLVVNSYAEDYSGCKRFLYWFDADGKVVFFTDATEQLIKNSGFVTGMAVDAGKRIYVFDRQVGIWLFDESGNYYGDIPYGNYREVFDLGALDLEDGRFLVCLRKGREAEYCTLAEVDFEKRQMTDVVKEFPAVRGISGGNLNYVQMNTGGTQDGQTQNAENASKIDVSGYDFLIYDEIAVYGYDLKKQTAEELFVWSDCDINGYFGYHPGVYTDNVLFCAVEDYQSDDKSIVLLTKRRSEEVPERVPLVLATVDEGTDELKGLIASNNAGQVIKMNRGSQRYHVTMKKYDSLTSLYNALLTKEKIDIIDLSGIDSGVNIGNLCRQGVLESLSPYLERSEKLSADDLVDGILKAYTFDGTLAGIPDSFKLRTMAGEKGKFGNSEGLTLDGFYEASKNTGGKVLAESLTGVTRDEMLRYLLMFNEDSFIDWKSGECHFETEQFYKILELAGSFPDTIKELTAEDVPRWYTINDGKALFAIADLDHIKVFQMYEHAYGDNAAFVGFPTRDGKGGTLLIAENAFGITACSEHKEAAWEFIEDFLCRQTLDGADLRELYMSYSIAYIRKYSARKDILEALVEFRMEEDEKREKTGKGFENWEPNYHCLTRADVDAVMKLVPDAIPFYSGEGDEVLRIISEEAGAYYSGQKSIEDVAGIIQNRVQLYVNENM